MQYATYETYSEPDGGSRSTGNDMTSRSHGLYAQEQLVLGPWVLRAGGRLAYTRHDYEKLGGATPGLSGNDWLKPLWSAGVRYNFSKWAGVYANAGSSYVTPDGKAVGGTLKWSDLGVIGRNGQLPNPDLKPESGIGIDVGADAWALNNLKISIRGFYNIVDDAITTVVVKTNPSQSRAINAGQAKSMGVEFDMKHMINKYIGWFANATYPHSEVSESLNPNEVGAELSFVPRWLANVGLTARLPYQFTVSPYVQYVGVYYDGIDKTGRNKFGDFGLVNLKILKPLYKIQGYMLNASLDVNNLFNRRYVMPWGFRDPGINALAKLELRF
jgi:iron complex outermembrane recepter protein